MGSRSRIRWHKVAKLAVGVFGCLALLLGLPSLIRRPEPPPLEPDIGLPPLAASQEPTPSGQRPARPERRAAKGRDRRRQGGRDRRGGGPDERRRLVTARRAARHEGSPPPTGSPVTGAWAPAPVPAALPAAPGPPPPVSQPAAPAPPPPARTAPPPPAPSEFGFER